MSRLDAKRPDLLGLPGRADRAVRTWLRRMYVLASGGGAWQVGGYEGESEPDVEVFQGIGFASRPAADAAAEAVVVKIGARSSHSVIVATRDEGTRVELDQDETAIFNSEVLIKITKDHDVIIRVAAGRTVTVDDGSGAAALATKADLQALRDFIDDDMQLTVVGGGGGTAGPGTSNEPPTPAGTSVLKGK